MRKLNFLGKFLFGVGKKPVPSQKEEEFENVDNFLNGSSDLNINTQTESRSTIYFKESADILQPDNSLEESKNIDSLQSVFTENEEVNENSEIAMIPEEEAVLFKNVDVKSVEYI